MNKQHFLLIALASLLSLPCLSFAKEANKLYKGCGADKSEARLHLGQNIYSDVKSSAKNKVTVKTQSLLDFFMGEQVGREDETSSLIESSVFLCNVNIVKTNGEYCAEVSKNALAECATNKLNTQLSYTQTNLNKFGDAKIKKAREWLDDIDSSKGLYTVVGDSIDQSKTDKLVGIEAHLLKVLDTQYARFDISGDNINIKLGDKKIQPNRDIALKVATHNYVITSPGHCPIVGEVKLTSKSKVVVSHKFSDYEYPEITFTSNQGNKVQLTVDGKNWPVSKTFSDKRCDGNLAYAFKFENDVEEGTVRLRPGLKTVVSENFTSTADRNARTQVANQYKQGSLYQADYLHMSLTSNSNTIDSMNGAKLSRTTLSNALRHGPSLIYAQDDKESYAVEFVYKLELQLLKIGKKQSPLGLGSIALIPHAGFDIGLGYHDLDGKDTFENPSSSEYEKFYKSFVVLRPSIGLGFPINGDFGLDLNYSRSLFMNKSNIFTIGINIRR